MQHGKVWRCVEWQANVAPVRSFTTGTLGVLHWPASNLLHLPLVGREAWSLAAELQMTTFTEFKTSVTVWSLEEPEYHPCVEVTAICDLLGAPRLDRSPAELYPQAKPLRLVSARDAACFLEIDLSRDATDQMEVVAIRIRCRTDAADAVDGLLRKIRSRSGVFTALLRGDLGLPEVCGDS